MDNTSSGLREILALQREKGRLEGAPDLKTRLERLDRLAAMLLAHEEEIIETEREDFASKSPTLIRLAEIMGSVSAIRATESELAQWMHPQPLHLSKAYEELGVSAEVRYQPKGVVGVVSPWNGPLILSCMPLAGILGAGNRAMIKPSELAPHSAALLERMVRSSFDKTEVAICQGGLDVAQEFIKLPFDHLLYTGSSRVAKLVMAAAAENLVPVTLELGGKCPVILGRDANLDVAIERLAYGKLIHGGQVCVTPDYLFVPEENQNEIVTRLSNAVLELYPSVRDNDDYSPILNEHHFTRLQGLVDDASAKGAEIICINPDNADLNPAESLKFPLHIILNVTGDMRVMQEEIFGPILPVMSYRTLNEVLNYIQCSPNPLSAYYFGGSAVERERICSEIKTGSIVFDDVVCQIFHEQIPFGGVGMSGMGRYRGHEGFKTFSNPVSVLSQTTSDDFMKMLRPPYSSAIDEFITQQLVG